MNPEQRGGIRPIWEKIDQETKSTGSSPKPERPGSPEARAEELFALWQDYRRLLREVQKFDRSEEIKAKGDQTYKPQQFAEPVALKKLETLRQAIAERWQDPQT